MSGLFSIARNTLIQNLRQPAMGAILLLTVFILVITVPLSTLSMGADYEAGDQQQLLSLGLGTLLFMGMIIAAMSSVIGISREIQDRTALTVIAKSVPRAVFLMGKFLGIVATVSVGYLLTTVVFLLTVRHGVLSSASQPYDMPVLVLGISSLLLAVTIGATGSYFFRWSFVTSSVMSLTILLILTLALVSIFGKAWQLQDIGLTFGAKGAITPTLIRSIFTIYLAVILLASVSVAASTRLSPLLTLLVSMAVLLGGMFQQYLSQNLATTSPGSEKIAWLLPGLSALCPSPEMLSRGDSFPIPYVLGYFVFYTAAMLLLGVVLFQTRELAAAESSSSLPETVALLAGLGRLIAVFAAAAGVLGLLRSSTYSSGDSLLLTSMMLVGGVVGWILWSAFNAGRIWAWWGVLLGATAKGFYFSALAAGYITWTPPLSPPPTMAAAICAGIAILMLMAKTRRHFFTKTHAG
jgi:ABC-type transport system involved in multi-copper enzyme maturation permease subunit